MNDIKNMKLKKDIQEKMDKMESDFVLKILSKIEQGNTVTVEDVKKMYDNLNRDGDAN